MPLIRTFVGFFIVFILFSTSHTLPGVVNRVVRGSNDIIDKLWEDRGSSDKNWRDGSSSGNTWSSTSEILSGNTDLNDSHHRIRGFWLNGFFHNTPYYTFKPMIERRGRGSLNGSTLKYSERSDDGYAMGYIISRALSNDFLAIFHVVRGISKLSEEIKNQ